jgi:hypothetical protein
MTPILPFVALVSTKAFCGGSGGGDELEISTTTGFGEGDFSALKLFVPSGVGDAWASRRERDEGRAAGELLDLPLEGKRCELFVTMNVSSTSGSGGGPGGSAEELGFGGLVAIPSFPSAPSAEYLFDDSRFLL